MNPGDPASYAYVATACFKLDNYTCAERGYNQAITITSQQPSKDAKATIPFRSNLGGVYHRTKQFEKAVQVRMSPKNDWQGSETEQTVLSAVHPPHSFTHASLVCLIALVLFLRKAFETAQSIAPDDESLAMNIKATIVDWHKCINRTDTAIV